MRGAAHAGANAFRGRATVSSRPDGIWAHPRAEGTPRADGTTPRDSSGMATLVPCAGRFPRMRRRGRDTRLDMGPGGPPQCAERPLTHHRGVGRLGDNADRSRRRCAGPPERPPHIEGGQGMAGRGRGSDWGQRTTMRATGVIASVALVLSLLPVSAALAEKPDEPPGQVAKADLLAQAITFTLPASGTVGDAVALEGSVDSGLPVEYDATPAHRCAVEVTDLGPILHLDAAGTCRVTASQRRGRHPRGGDRGRGRHRNRGAAGDRRTPGSRASSPTPCPPVRRASPTSRHPPVRSRSPTSRHPPVRSRSPTSRQAPGQEGKPDKSDKPTAPRSGGQARQADAPRSGGQARQADTPGSGGPARPGWSQGRTGGSGVEARQADASGSGEQARDRQARRCCRRRDRHRAGGAAVPRHLQQLDVRGERRHEDALALRLSRPPLRFTGHLQLGDRQWHRHRGLRLCGEQRFGHHPGGLRWSQVLGHDQRRHDRGA